jgi:anti-anti-sigma factor
MCLIAAAASWLRGSKTAEHGGEIVDSRISGQPCGEPVTPAFPNHAPSDGEPSVPPAGRLSPVPLLDGSSPLQVSLTRSPLAVRLAGDVDERTYHDLTKVLEAVAATGERTIRIDLADVSYCDLAGLRAIIMLAGAREDGRPGAEQLVLAHLPSSLRTVLRIAGWDTTPGLVVEDEASQQAEAATGPHASNLDLGEAGGPSQQQSQR